jgi:hypothetical protein
MKAHNDTIRGQYKGHLDTEKAGILNVICHMVKNYFSTYIKFSVEDLSFRLKIRLKKKLTII